MRGFFTSNGSSGGYECGLMMLDTLFLYIGCSEFAAVLTRFHRTFPLSL